MSSTRTKELLNIHEYNQLSEPIKADLFEIMYQFADEINDDSTCYFGHAALQFANKKMLAAEKSYAKLIGNGNKGNSAPKTSLNGFVLLVDTTTFGKGDEGFYLTEDRLLGRQKALFSDEILMEYRLSAIDSIDIKSDGIVINNTTFKYSGVSEKKMKIIVDCIKTYIQQL